MHVNDIPHEERKRFPAGVGEYEYDTGAEMQAFIDGVSLPDDVDVEVGDAFQRDGKWVVRVRIGDWPEDEPDEIVGD